jgi:hypothetical protein
MLPDPDHAWLPDAEGRRYTSELRLVAVDLKDHHEPDEGESVAKSRGTEF